MIIDVSEWQEPSKINYDVLCQQVTGVIIRVQYGSNYVDKHYQTHIKEFTKRDVPFAVYAWVRGSSNADMEKEATDFYNRVAKYNPQFWWLDIEEQSMRDMRMGCERYRWMLKRLGAKKVGCYIANHLYKGFNIDVNKFDGVWIPTYGKNNGKYEGSKPTATNEYDIHQYTSEGKLKGYNGALDLNRIVRKGFDYFFQQNGKRESSNVVSGTGSVVSKGGKLKVKKITVASDGVKLRSSVSVKNDTNVIAKLKKNDVVEIDDIVFANGFVWGVRPRSNGKKGYVDIGKSVNWVK